MTIEKIYWDSACFLSHFHAEVGQAEKCDGVLQRAETVQKFFRRSYIRVYNVSRKLAESAQELVWDNSIKPKDAIHVATPIHLGADALETFDKNLIGKSGTVGTPLLLIREPQAAAQGRFPLAGSAEDAT